MRRPQASGRGLLCCLDQFSVPHQIRTRRLLVALLAGSAHEVVQPARRFLLSFKI
ncbi:hypothetical protein ACFVWY_00390 [Streptomyces sp. NPDC058195]|uniref:hypothetical protein n=1 Tax=Streptomyces sp. NPDC058195 TaxID=3346375 RepID=UPI0036E1095A